MIQGSLVGVPGRRRPLMIARVQIPSQRVGGDVTFLIDTGADSTLLAPADVLALKLDLGRARNGPETTGVGGTMGTVLSRIPSLLGRDILSQFALFFEERTRRVLLLEPDEAERVPFP